MDQAQPWTAKRKHGAVFNTTDNNNNSHHQDRYHQPLLHLHRRFPSKASYDDSWEEQAFAEDASGPLGGCVWPPRSYNCSFCLREFRSAQALGGHMNVHRRDRARLKQSPPSDLHHEITSQQKNNNNNIPLHHNHISPLMISSLGGTTSNTNTITSTLSQIPQFPISQVCPLGYINPNPNSDLPHLGPNKKKINNCHVNEIQELPPPHHHHHHHNSSSSSTSFLLQEKNNNNNKWSNTPIYSWSNLTSTNNIADRCYSYKPNHQKESLGDQKVSSITVESGGSCTDHHHQCHHVKTDLSVNLNLVLCRSCTTTNLSGHRQEDGDDDDDHIITSTCKRRKASDDEDHHHHDQAVIISPCSVEELDLELRIGVGSHKVKY